MPVIKFSRCRQLGLFTGSVWANYCCRTCLLLKLYFDQEGVCTPKLRILARHGKSTDLERRGRRNFMLLGIPKILLHYNGLKSDFTAVWYYLLLAYWYKLNCSFRTPTNALLIYTNIGLYHRCYMFRRHCIVWEFYRKIWKLLQLNTLQKQCILYYSILAANVRVKRGLYILWSI